MILASAVGTGWLGYLTFNGIKNFCKNPDADDANEDQKCVNNENKGS